MARHKKLPGEVFDVAFGDGPQGGGQGWHATKKYSDSFHKIKHGGSFFRADLLERGPRTSPEFSGRDLDKTVCHTLFYPGFFLLFFQLASGHQAR
ncbi:hypothetical protein [Brenneria corticis]|uniref:Uncharacterized protein n=1 Tax=Brenneria corticis TaxID=2173106 RepID=A0A2U1U870_9GAMM|nr:hypothetical protein [Brenneria sp. CFCC 11842]PWC17866.1 hypothetical protein DDT56_06385 [Brenneria sp. CFCC 11842]